MYLFTTLLHVPPFWHIHLFRSSHLCNQYQNMNTCTCLQHRCTFPRFGIHTCFEVRPYVTSIRTRTRVLVHSIVARPPFWHSHPFRNSLLCNQYQNTNTCTCLQHRYTFPRFGIHTCFAMRPYVTSISTWTRVLVYSIVARSPIFYTHLFRSSPLCNQHQDMNTCTCLQHRCTFPHFGIHTCITMRPYVTSIST